MQQNHLSHTAISGSQRHANRDLVHALRNAPRYYPVKADGCEDYRKAGQRGDQSHGELPVPGCITHRLTHELDRKTAAFPVVFLDLRDAAELAASGVLCILPGHALVNEPIGQKSQMLLDLLIKLTIRDYGAAIDRLAGQLVYVFAKTCVLHWDNHRSITKVPWNVHRSRELAAGLRGRFTVHLRHHFADRIEDAVLDIFGVGARLAIVEHALIGFVAAFLQHSARRNIGHHVV